MDIRGIGRALRRQWVVALIIGIATVVVAASAMGRVETKYQGQASLLFVSSPLSVDNQGDPISVNPFSLSGNAERVASSAILALSRSAGFADALTDAGVPGKVRFRRTSDAILDAKASAATPDGAIRTLDAAMTIVREQLDAQQAAAGAPLGSYMKIETLAHSDNALPIEGNPFRAVGAIVLIGIVIAIAAVVAVDAAAPNAIRRGGAWTRRGARTLVGRLTGPPALERTDAANRTQDQAPAPAAAPANRNGIGNREARRRAARAGRGNGAGPPQRPGRGEDRTQPAARQS